MKKLALGMIKIKQYSLLEIFDDLYHICMALLPVLYIVNVPGFNMSLGTVILLVFVPYSLVFILKGLNHKSKINVFIFFIFYMYLIFRSDGNTTRIILCCTTFIILYGQMKGATKIKKIRKIIETFAIINVILLVLQIISYYGFHFRIQYIPRNLIYKEYQNSYVFREFTGLYRPSALFLEPSHFSQFCIFALISALFPVEGKEHFKKALAIGIGCILTTSGMGIALTFGVFSWYMILNRQRLDKKILNILKWISVLTIVLLILSRTTFFQTSLQRIFSTVEGYNAVSGRTHNWDATIGYMHGQTLLFGYGDNQTYKFYLTGLADTIYKYGILCVILEGLCFLYLMIKKVDNYVWCCCIVFSMLFCVAHIMNFVAQVFYFGIIIADVNVPKIKHNIVINNCKISRYHIHKGFL